MSLTERKLIPAIVSFLLSAALFPAAPASAQTLFTVDGDPVSKEAFLKAYKKNNSREATSAASYKDYLELYIRYKLKVRAAYAMHLDTLPGQRTELQNFRSQVSEPYMTDEESMNRLVNEAFVRGQKDIHLAHIFVALPKQASPFDTLRAYEKAMEAYGVLKKKRGFGETALAYSEDPSARTNQGDVGFLTVFTLPYELESQAYALTPGQFSKPFRTRAGYHIFKDLGERKAAGKIKVAQILLTLPPGTTDAAREAIRVRADSIFASLQKGANFAELARTYSGDNLSYQNGGELPEFGVGKYDSLFEAMAFSLTRDGEIGKPFLSSYGYHILRRITRIPFPRQLSKETMAALKGDILADPRMELVRKAMINKIYRQAGFTPSLYSQTDLWGFTDSAARNRGLPSYHNLEFSTVLFTLGRRQYTVKEWLDYLQTLRNSRPGLLSGKSNPEVFEQWQRTVALDYYRSHLEDFNKDFAFQLNEFKEGNLLFEIMQRKVWEKASTDNAGLRTYYDAHKDKYWWEASADAVLFTCNNEQTANLLRQRVAADPASWKRWADSAGAAVQADSGRFELTQIPSPGKEKIDFVVGRFTPVTKNMADNTVSFSYILNIYKDRAPRNFKDARGFVINDYQNFLEDQWVAGLRKQYPVKVNEAVLASLTK
ncbi:MAG: peptidylprolyl isomerase [Bacteroidota bacterium]|nr:peptidylprolyl isomerase [Bacteroidota bacterium]